MSGKSKHHKVTNTFHFQSFHERLAGVNIDVARKFGKLAAVPEDHDTFFGEGLQKWSELNLTRDFVAFRASIRGEVDSFVQLLHNQDEVFEALIYHLQVPNSLALQPILDLVVQLARDLQNDFYPCFPRVFAALVSLLSNYSKDVGTLEACFKCLAYLIKFLWRALIADIPAVFKMYRPLLGNHTKPYITKFAAESFSFLMRKVRDKKQLFTFLFNEIKQDPKLAGGVGTLLFQMIKGVKNQFHSSTEQVLPVLLASLGSSDLAREPVMQAMTECVSFTAQHTNHQHAQPIINTLLRSIVDVHASLSSVDDNDLKTRHLTSLITLLRVFVQFKDGKLVDGNSGVPKTLHNVLVGPVLAEDCIRELFYCMVDLLLAPSCTPDYPLRLKLINQLYNSPYDRKIIFEITGMLFELPMRERDFKPAVETYLHKLCVQRITDTQKKIKNEKKMGDNTESTIYDDVTRLLLAWSHTVDGNIVLDFTIPNRRFPESNDHPGFTSWLSDSLTNYTPETIADNLCVTRAKVHLLSHVSGIDSKAKILLLTHVLPLASTLLKDEQHSEKAITLIWEIIKTLHQTSNNKLFTETIKEYVNFDDIIGKFPTNVYLLESCSLFYKSLHTIDPGDPLLSEDGFKNIWPHMRENLWSPYHLVRMYTLDICRQFALPLPKIGVEGMTHDSVFEICYAAECTDSTVQAYRDKLVHLRKLEHACALMCTPVGADYAEIPLRYLLGALYVNMKLLWEPIQQLIASHATSMHRDKFWAVLHPRLEHLAQLSEEALNVKETPKDHKRKSRALHTPKIHQSYDSSEEDLVNLNAMTMEEIFTTHAQNVFSHSDRANHSHMRSLLWQAMESFAGVCEARSRLLVPLLFRFLQNEYYPVNPDKSKFVSIKGRNTTNKPKPKQNPDIEIKLEDVVDLTATSSQDEDEEMEISQSESLIEISSENEEDMDNEQEEIKQSTPSVDIKRGTASAKALVMHLTLFSQFKNPKSIYLEPKLKELYLDLISNVDPALQKVAWSCVMTYEYKYLTPYRENFERLLDDKTFRSELVMFGIDPQTTAIQSDHRAQLVPLLMRLLYGKMQGNSPKSKMSREHKRHIIIRFLAGTQSEELDVFISLLLAPFKHLFDDRDLAEVTLEECKSDNVTKIVPLSKQHTLLSVLELVQKKLGNLVAMDLSRLLRVIVILQAQHVRLINSWALVAKRYSNTLKTLRKLSQSLVIDFFSRFAESYNFSEHETEAIFSAMVWPRLDKLAQEGLKSTTGLTALFNTWTHHSRYFPLLGKVNPQNSSITPLPQIFKLLSAPAVSKPVAAAILEIVENLLTVEDFEPHGEVKVVPVGQSVKLAGDEEMTLGMRLLLPHVTTILDYLKQVVQKMVSNKKRSKIPLPKTELTILSKLSQYISDDKQCMTILELLIPFLGRRVNRQPATELHILTAIKHLLCHVSEPEHFIKDIVRLFSILYFRESRNALCDVINTLSANRLPRYKFMADVLTRTNAWDAKHIDEPDYILRLAAYRDAGARIQSIAASPASGESDDSNSSTPRDTQSKNEALDLVMGIAFIHNCAYYLSTSEDMSIRDNAGLLLTGLISKIAEYGSESPLYKELVIGHILPLVRLNLKSARETTRHEFVHILGALVKHFARLPQFRALAGLRHYGDEEADIFSALTHVQLPRRAKGVKRLVRHLQTPGVTISVDMLLHFVLPIVSALLREERYTQITMLRDAAIECIGVVCRYLPWRMYSHLLEEFLEQLGRHAHRQKITVRILVAILDSFHFDLSASWTVKPLGEGESTSNKENIEATKEDSDKENKQEVENDQDGEEEEGSDDESEETDDVVTMNDDVTTIVVGDNQEAKEGDLEASGSEVNKVTWTTCDAAQATAIHKHILHVVIPKMHHSLTKKRKRDDVHKKSGLKRKADEEEVLRVPLALAMVKLLQALPKETLNAALPSILIKICVFLRSRDSNVRTSARSTLVHILKCLGAQYLHFILAELGTSLQRGYQLHVLSYTVWDLIHALHNSGKLKPGDIDTAIPKIVKILQEELFGAVSEEKEVKEITGKLFEAKQVKTYDTYGLLGQLASKSTLPELIIPLKEVCDGTTKHEWTRKASEALRRVGLSVVANPALDLRTILTLIYGILTEQVPFLNPKYKEGKVVKDETKSRFKSDTFTVYKQPGRGGYKPKTHAVTNSHIIVDFGLQVLNMLMKKNVIDSTITEHLQLVDPFVQPLLDCLSSKHLKVTTTALRCLQNVFRLPLPELERTVSGIAKNMFVLLNKYACTGAASSEENFILVQQCFKAMSVLVRDVQYHTLEADQLKVLLVYAEQDIHDHTRQGTAFTLLKAILKRKLTTPEMPQVISKVEELSIQSQDGNVRQQCRQVVSAFLMDYPVGDHLRKHLAFFIRQLDYEQETGRQSALEMLVTLFNAFPIKVLVEYAGFFFVPLASRCVNDESAECRKQAQLAIKQLLVKLDGNQRDGLFSMCVAWMQENKPVMRKLAAIAMAPFVAVEATNFQRHISTLLPILANQIQPHKYSQEGDAAEVKVMDHLLYNLLNLLSKVTLACDVIRNPKHADVMADIWDYVRCHCEHAHAWVRLAAAQLFGLYLAAWSPEELLECSVNSHTTEEKEEGGVDGGKRRKAESDMETEHAVEYLVNNLEEKLHDLCGTFCIQLTLVDNDADLAEQIVKNLVFIAKVLVLKEQKQPFDRSTMTSQSRKRQISNETNDTEEVPVVIEKTASLHWLIRKLCRETFVELSKNRKSILVRSSVFKWLAALGLELGAERIGTHLPIMLGPLVREYTDPSSSDESELKQLAGEVLDLLKKVAGVERFSEQFSLTQKHLAERRAARKQTLAAEVVTNPEIATLRKIKKHLNKREAKKRKIIEKKPFKAKKLKQT